MNFNVYLKKEIGQKITKKAKALHRSRNAIINEALEEWLQTHTQSSWPSNFFDFDAVKDVPDFQQLRRDLLSPPEDPLE